MGKKREFIQHFLDSEEDLCCVAGQLSDLGEMVIIAGERYGGDEAAVFISLGTIIKEKSEHLMDGLVALYDKQATTTA